MSAPLRIGSLFTGTGVLDAAALYLLGEESRVVWHSEISPAACALLDYRDPGVPNLGDICKIDPAAVEPVDALTFGWPCQPFSSAGKRLGEADPRALWPEVARLVAGLRPRYLFGENVARVASNGELARVVRDLAALGYVGTYRTLRASDVGAPHRRDRLALFAVHADAAPDTERLGLAGRSPDTAGAPDAFRDGSRAAATGRSADVSALNLPLKTPTMPLLPTPAAGLGMSGNVTEETAKARAARRGNGPNLDDAIALLPTPSASSYGTNQGGAAGRVGEVRESLDTMARHDRIAADRWGKYAAAVTRWEQVLGRPAPEPTMLGAKGGRVLAPAFVEWLMGLPAGWVDEVPGLTRPQKLALLGNGVVPQWAVAAFTELTARMFHVEHVAA